MESHIQHRWRYQEWSQDGHCAQEKDPERASDYIPSFHSVNLYHLRHNAFQTVLFEAALTVNLTSMLVMTTIFISVMERLPSTAYIKHIDIWLIGGQLLPFMEVVILTIKEKLRDDSSNTNSHDTNDSRDTTEKKKTPTKKRIINHHGCPRTIKVQ